MNDEIPEVTVPDLDLVEARVHMAAAAYHHCLANGKLMPRPPSAPRTRPASAGFTRPAATTAQVATLCRPTSAQQSSRSFVSDIRSACETAASCAVLLGPWGSCIDAPPHIITGILEELSECLQICATHGRRQPSSPSKQKPMHSSREPVSSERLHANLVGRCLGRSFYKMLLLTRALHAFREVTKNSSVKTALEDATRYAAWSKQKWHENSSMFHDRSKQRTLTLIFFKEWSFLASKSAAARKLQLECTKRQQSFLLLRVKAVKKLARRADWSLLSFCLSAWQDFRHQGQLNAANEVMGLVRKRMPDIVVTKLLQPVREVLLWSTFTIWIYHQHASRDTQQLEDVQLMLDNAIQLAAERQHNALELSRKKELVVKLATRQICRLAQNADWCFLRSCFTLWKLLQRCSQQALDAKITCVVVRGKAVKLIEKRSSALVLSHVLQDWCAAVKSSKHHESLIADALCRGKQVSRQELDILLNQCFFHWCQATALTRKVQLEESINDLAMQEKKRRLGTVLDALTKSSANFLQTVFASWCLVKQASDQERLQRERAMQQAARTIAGCDELLLLQVFRGFVEIISKLRQQRELEDAKQQIQQQIEELRRQAAIRFNEERLQAEQEQQKLRQKQLSLFTRSFAGMSEQGLVFSTFEAWKQTTEDEKSRLTQKQQSHSYLLRNIASSSEALATMCFSAWRRETEACRYERMGGQAVRQAKQTGLEQTMQALRKHACMEEDAVLNRFFSVWHRVSLEARLLRTTKDAVLRRAQGAIRAEEDVIRCQCFSSWYRVVLKECQERDQAAAAEQIQQRFARLAGQCSAAVSKLFQVDGEAILLLVFESWRSCQRMSKERLISKQRYIAEIALDSEMTLSKCFRTWQLSVTDARLEQVTIEEKRRQEIEARSRQQSKQAITMFFTNQLRLLLQACWTSWIETILGYRIKRSKQSTQGKIIAMEDQHLLSLVIAFWSRTATLLKHAKALQRHFAKITNQDDKDLLLAMVFFSWVVHTLKEHDERESKHLRDEVYQKQQEAAQMRLQVNEKRLNAIFMAINTSSQTLLAVIFSRWSSMRALLQAQASSKDHTSSVIAHLCQSSNKSLLSLFFLSWSRAIAECKQEKFLLDAQTKALGLERAQQKIANICSKVPQVLQRQRRYESIASMFWSFRYWHLTILSTRAAKQRRMQTFARTLTQLPRLATWQLSYVVRVWALLCKFAKQLKKRYLVIQLGRRMAVKLQSKASKLEVLRMWQSACIIQDTSRTLDETEADLRGVAEAAAAAENAAEAASAAARLARHQRTVHMNPMQRGITAWPIKHVPSSSEVDIDDCPLDFQFLTRSTSAASNFQAPMRSLQMDIQRHAEQIIRLQEQRGRLRPQSAGAGRVRPEHYIIEAVQQRTRLQ